MTQKIVVNGTEYDSPEAMPPEVRRQYEQALRLVQDVAKGAAPPGTMARTVETTRDGVSVKVHTKQLKYTVDGKSYDDPTQLPPEVRARVEQALHGVEKRELHDPGPREVRIVNVVSEMRSRAWVPRIIWWLVIGTLVAVVVLSRLRAHAPMSLAERVVLGIGAHRTVQDGLTQALKPHGRRRRL